MMLGGRAGGGAAQLHCNGVCCATKPFGCSAMPAQGIRAVLPPSQGSLGIQGLVMDLLLLPWTKD